jgi:hypothetical protein
MNNHQEDLACTDFSILPPTGSEKLIENQQTGDDF